MYGLLSPALEYKVNYSHSSGAKSWRNRIQKMNKIAYAKPNVRYRHFKNLVRLGKNSLRTVVRRKGKDNYRPARKGLRV